MVLFGSGLSLEIGGVKRGVEGGQINHAEPDGPAAAVSGFDNLGFGRKILQEDFIADQAHDFAVGSVRAGRNNSQAHLGALGATNELHGFRQAHFHDIHGRLIALRHRHDAIVDLEELALDRGAARQEPAYLAIAVFGRKLRPDTKEAQVHANRELLQLPVAKIIRVRIVNMGQRREIDLENVFVVPFREEPQVAEVTVAERVHNLLLIGLLGEPPGSRFGGRVRFGERWLGLGAGGGVLLPGIHLPQQFLQVLEPQPLLPELLRFVEIGRIRHLFPAYRNPVIGVEGELLMLQHIFGVSGALLQAFHEPVED